MHPAETLLNNITPSLNGLMVDLIAGCIGIIFLVLISVSFWVLYEALFAHEKADDCISADESRANYQWAISKSKYSSPYEKEVARKKFNRMVNKAASEEG